MTKVIFIFLLSLMRLSAQEASFFDVLKSDKNDDEVNPAYFKLDVSIPLRENPYRDETDPATGERGYWFTPNGINARIGIGYNYENLFTIGGTTGIDWKATPKVVAVPIFAEARLSPMVGEELRFFMTAGYGHAFAVGRGNLNGNFQKYSLGLGTEEGSYFFVEFTYYGFPIHETRRYGALSLGISFQIL